MLRPHLKPSNQRHLPYSSAYSASKRALAPVPPLPTLTATIPPPIPPHRLEVLTRPREAISSPPPSHPRHLCSSLSPSMNRPQSWLISPSSMSSISSISSSRSSSLSSLSHSSLSHSPSQRSSQTTNASNTLSVLCAPHTVSTRLDCETVAGVCDSSHAHLARLIDGRLGKGCEGGGKEPPLQCHPPCSRVSPYASRTAPFPHCPLTAAPAGAGRHRPRNPPSPKSILPAKSASTAPSYHLTFQSSAAH